jgi:hypothetical protein
VIFHYQGQVKTVYISIPQSPAFDFPSEQQRLVEEIRANFEALLVLSSQEQLLLLDAQRGELDVSSLVLHYSDYGKDQLVDPFSDEEVTHKGPLHVWLETTLCKLQTGARSGRMTRFLHSIIDQLVKPDKTDVEVECAEAAMRLMFALLSSHLYTKSYGQEYSLAPKSPALQVFHLLSVHKAEELTSFLLEWFMEHYEDKPQVQPTFFSRMWRRVRTTQQPASDINRTSQRLADYSLKLALLLMSYQGNALFAPEAWQCDWEDFYQIVIKHQSDRLVELLAVLLTLQNEDFFTFLVSRAEPEALLEPLCKRVFEGEQQAALYLELLLVLRLSEDHLFTRFLFADVQLPSVAWIPDYQVTQMSVGSLLFFTLLQSLRANLKGAKEPYLHVLICACLFNLSEQALNLHEVPSMTLVSLIKVLFGQWKKKQSPTAASLLSSLVDILSNILKSNACHNPKLAHAILHDTHLFDQMAEASFSPQNIGVVRELSQYLLADLDLDHLEDTVTSRLRVYNANRFPVFEVFGGVAKFKLSKLGQEWEPFLVPYVWTELMPLLWKPETAFLTKTRPS